MSAPPTSAKRFTFATSRSAPSSPPQKSSQTFVSRIPTPRDSQSRNSISFAADSAHSHKTSTSTKARKVPPAINLAATEKTAEPAISFVLPQARSRLSTNNDISRSSTDSSIRPPSVRSGSSQSIPNIDGTSTDTNSNVRRIGRCPSPPPPPTYKPRIAFDLFANQSLTDPSFTLISQHKAYVRTKTSRTYLCGTDETDYAAFALEYLIDELVDDGDDIVCVRVVDRDTEVAVGETEYKLKAQQVQQRAQEILNGPHRPAVKVVIEFAIGKVGETIDRMVNLHTPLSIVVGTRGKSLAGSSFGKTSVSQYLYQHSPVPVIIVRPVESRQKHLRKRQNDPERRKYAALSAKASHKMEVASASNLEASQHERDAVARAIGLPDNIAQWRPGRRPSNTSKQPRSRSRERRSSNASALSVASGTSSTKGAQSDDTSDDDEGSSLSRKRASGANTDEDDDEDDDTDLADNNRFEDMPNFVAGLAHDQDEDEIKDDE